MLTAAFLLLRVIRRGLSTPGMAPPTPMAIALLSRARAAPIPIPPRAIDGTKPLALDSSPGSPNSFLTVVLLNAASTVDRSSKAFVFFFTLSLLAASSLRVASISVRRSC